MTFGTPEIYFHILARNHFNFQLTWGTRIDHEQFACNVVAHVVDQVVFNFNEKF